MWRWHGLWTGVYVCWSMRDGSDTASASLSSIVGLSGIGSSSRSQGTETRDRELPWSSHMPRKDPAIFPTDILGVAWGQAALRMQR